MLENYLGKTIMLNCRPEFIETNRGMIQKASDSPLFYAKLVSVDDIGLWIENPNFEVWKKQDGNPEHHRANILVPWNSVVSVALFPERKFLSDGEIYEKEATSIGFHPEMAPEIELD